MMQNRSLFSFVCALLISCSSQAQTLTIPNTITPAQLVSNVLLGQGVLASNITWNGDAVASTNTQTSAFKFTSTGGAFPFSEGVYLRTKNAYNVSLDPDLNIIASNEVVNGSILEFDFVATSNSFVFKYMFASEEYPNYVCSRFNDVFGFFISGPGISGPYSNNAINIALIPNTDIPVMINTVNSGSSGNNGAPSGCAAQDPNWVANSQYYTTTYSEYAGEHYNGGTIPLPAGTSLICGETYHIKLAICNVGDPVYDSGVYLEAGSFTSLPVNFSFNTYADNNTVYEGCNQLGTLVFTRSGCNVSNDSLVAYISFSGQSQNGVDYNLLGDSIYFEPGEDSVIWQIIPIEDGIAEGIESLNITITSTMINGDTIYSHGTFYLNDLPVITLTAPDVTYQCLRDSAQLVATATGGSPPFTYLWGHGAVDSAITVPLNGNGIYGYKVTVTDACGQTKSDSVYVNMNQTLAIDSMQQFPSTACLPTGKVTGFASGFTGTPVYSWSGPGANSPNTVSTPVFENLAVGWYYFSVTDNICSAKDSIFLKQEPAPIASFTASAVSGCSLLSVTFTNASQHASSYVWDFGNNTTVTVNNLDDQTVIYDQNAVVRLIASKSGCSDTMILAITTIHCGCTDPDAINYDPTAQADDGSCSYPMPAVEVPNVFTPDGDNTNNLFFLNAVNAVNVEMWIYNRWGNEMYHGSGLNPAWDGKSDSNEAAEGVYFMKYIVKGYNKSLEGQGFFHLIRK